MGSVAMAAFAGLSAVLPLGQSTYAAPVTTNAAAPAMAHQTIGEIPAAAGSAAASAVTSIGGVMVPGGAASRGTSKLNSEGTTVLTVDESERSDSAAMLETAAAGIDESAAQPSGA